jgi:hypothetical protein
VATIHSLKLEEELRPLLIGMLVAGGRGSTRTAETAAGHVVLHLISLPGCHSRPCWMPVQVKWQLPLCPSPYACPAPRYLKYGTAPCFNHV